MRPVDAIARLNDSLSDIAGRRERLAQELDKDAIRLGAIAALLKARYAQSQAASAARAGLSAAYLGELVARAETAGVAAPDPLNSLVWVHGSVAGDYVRQRGAAVDRVIASFSDFDLLYLSGVHPTALDRGPDHSFLAPHMMWHLDPDDEWIAIDHVQVGYGGSGPGLALEALRDGLGIEPELAKRIAYSRVSNTDMRTGKGWWRDDWPYLAVPALQLHPDGFAYSRMTVDERRPSPGGPREASPLETWLKMLDGSDCPPWAAGPRTARIFFDPQAAADQGFMNGRPPYNIIIEQGDLQLWLKTFQPRDQTQWLSDEAYEALRTADLYPAGLAAKDARSQFWRWVETHVVNRMRPPYIDVGAGQLWHQP